MDFLTSAYTSLRSKLLGRTRAMIPDADAADDVLQEAFYKLWAKKYRPANQKEAEALLARTVRNTGIDELRHLRPKVPLGGGELKEFPQYEKKEQLRIVENIISEQLTQVQQLIIRRKEYEGFEITDIAKELGMEEAAVRMQLSRARKKIREIYNKQEL
ncbi:MAG: RNA polymerase sigma factor [Bacteroidales bacterium]|nr:RNA polymerase sigma factor [Bacteroidales bacterium]